jgi:hypothetical protein
MSRTFHRVSRAFCPSWRPAKRRRGLRCVFRPEMAWLEDRLTPSGNLVISSDTSGFTALSGTWSNAVALSNGNLVLIDAAAPSVSLCDGKTGALISTLKGALDVTPLTNGNFVAYNLGGGISVGNTLTWCSGTTGLNGTVSANNSLTLPGPPPDNLVVTPLTNGNYVVDWEGWNGGRGAVTWCDGTESTIGTVSSSNSLIGNLGDYVGGDSNGVMALPDGNYLVGSSNWNNDAGAVTWGDGTQAISGTVSTANSLIGSHPKDFVGELSWGPDGPGIIVLTNGNYVVTDPPWNNHMGAVTWGNAATGARDVISTSNSVVGSDEISGGGQVVVALTNGNYVVDSPDWNNDAGAVTWCDGTKPSIGAVSASNSLVGGSAGFGRVTALINGNYVVDSWGWNNVNNDVGAVTWCDGSMPTVGTVSTNNSLTGTAKNDFVGRGGVTALQNGNYVVSSPQWDGSDGAVTWCDGTKSTVGAVSSANSLVGSARTGGATDQVGGGTIVLDHQSVSLGGVTALPNGNYVVDSPLWDGNAGAVTWGDGETGAPGIVGTNNSLVGSYSGDFVGFQGVTALSSGNYVVDSPKWNNSEGAVTWGDGRNGLSGMISDANSLLGSTAGDQVGGSQMEILQNGQAYFYNGGITALPNGNYVVLSPYWNNGKGAATWGNGAQGTLGVVSFGNSLIDSPSFSSGTGVFGVDVLPNSNYLVGATPGGEDGYFETWVDGTNGTTWDGQNTPDAQNSFYGGGGPDIPLLSGGGAFLKIEGYNSGAPATGEIVVTDPNDLININGLFPGQTITVSPDMLTRALDEGNAVTVQASDDITIDSPITANPTGKPSGLTLKAGRSILVNAGINTAGGDLTLIANDSVADGIIDSQRGTGDAEITMVSGGTLNAGSGTLSVDLKQSTDKTNNGSGVATLLGVTASTTTLSGATTLGISINGTSPGDGIASGTHTQVDVTGPINLNGATLQVADIAVDPAGTTYTIVQTTGGVSGTLNGLPEGARVDASDGSAFTISYRGDSDLAVVLTRVAGAPSQLVIKTQPSPTATAGVAFSTQPVVYVEDQNGNLETGDNTTQVTAALGSGTGPLMGTTRVTVSGGVATFTNLSDNLAEIITLHFTSSPVLTAATSSNIVISAAAARQLAIHTQPSPTATAGTAFSTQPIVYVEDQYGNLETSNNATQVTVALNSGTGPLLGATTVRASGGIATFTNLADDTAETITLHFTCSPVLNAATSSNVVIGAAAASQLAIHSQPSPTATAGTVFGTQPVVYVEDQYGNIETSDNSTNVTATSLPGGSGPLQGTTTVTASGGIATFTNLADNKAETITIHFISSPVLTAATSSNVVISAAAAIQLAIHTQPSPTATAGVAFGTQPVVYVEDRYGNLEVSYNATQVTVALNSGTGPLLGTTTVTVSGGIATFTDLSGNLAETITLHFISSPVLTAATSNNIVISAAAASQLAIHTQPSPTATAGAAFGTQPVIYVEDKYGNLETGDSATQVTAALGSGTGPLVGTTVVGASGGIATFAHLADDTAETITLHFTSSPVLTAATSSNVVISAAAANQLAVHTQPSPTATAGTVFGTQPVVYVEDAFGNLETSNNATQVTIALNSGTVPLLGTTTVTASGGIATFTNLADDTAETITLHFTSSPVLAAATSNNVVISAAAANQLAIHTQPSPTATAGTAFGSQPVVYVEDQYGNIETGDNSTNVRATSLPGGSGPLQGTTMVTASGGIATFTNLADNKAETITIHFTSSPVLTAATSNSVVVDPTGVPTKLAVITQPSSTATAGVAFSTQPVVCVEDQYGNVETGDNATRVTVALNSGAGPLLGTTTVTVSRGIAMFTDLSDNLAETITLHFTGSPVLAAATSNNVVISAAAASQLAIHTRPSPTAMAGTVFGTQPVVYVEDKYGNLETGDSATQVTAALGSGTGPLVGTTVVTASGGIATFAHLTDDTAETITLHFTSSPVLTAATSSNVVINAAVASQLAIHTQPSPTATAGTAFGSQPVVYVEDQYGNIETGDNSTNVTATSLPGGSGPLKGTTTVTASGGIATFTNLADNKAETITIHFTSSPVLTAATSNSVVVDPTGVPTKLAVITQPSSTATAGVAYSTQPVLCVEDQYGNPETGDNATQVAVALNSGAGPLLGTTTVTVSHGIATFMDLSDNLAETSTLHFTSSPVLTAATSNNIVISAAAASQLAIHSQPSPTATAGAAFGTQPVVYVEDKYGNLETGNNATQVTAALGSGTGPLVGTTVVTASDGIATFAHLADDTAETITLHFTSSPVLTAATSSNIVINAAAASQLAIHTQPSPTATAGTVFGTQPVLYVEDQYGNLETGDNSTNVTATSLPGGSGPLKGTTTVTASGGIATFTNLADNKAETITIHFTSSPVLTAATSSDVVISAAAAAQLAFTTQPPPTATAGVAFVTQPVVYVEDQYGNLITGDNSTQVTAVTYQIGSGPLQGTTTITASGGIATFTNLADNKAETTSLQVLSIPSLASAISGNIVISAAAATQLVIHIQPAATASAGQPLATQPVIYEEDRYGNLETGDNRTEVTAVLSSGTGPLEGATTVTVTGGVATFTDLADGGTGTFSLQFTSGRLSATPTTSIAVTATTPPTVLREQVVTTQKTNKKGKPVGKPILAGFALDFSTAMNPATAGLAANYQVDSTITKRVKKKTVTALHPVRFTAAYNSSTYVVTLTIRGKPKFATGGKIKVITSSPNGVTSEEGVALDASEAAFTIRPKARGITPG